MEESEDREDQGYHFHYGRRQEAGAVPPAYGSTDFGGGVGYDSEDADLESGSPDRQPKMARNSSSSSSKAPLNPQKPPSQGSPKKISKNRKPLFHPPDFRARFTGLNRWQNRVSISVYSVASLISSRGPGSLQNSKEQIILQTLTSKDRVNIRYEPMHMFLFHDGKRRYLHISNPVLILYTRYRHFDHAHPHFGFHCPDHRKVVQQTVNVADIRGCIIIDRSSPRPW